MLSELCEARNELSRWMQRIGQTRLRGIGVGLRVTNEKRLEKTCLQLFVERKQARDALSRRDAIPGSLDGIDIDVVPTATAVLNSLPATAKKTFEPKSIGRSRYRPLVGGVSCSNLFTPSGTLGCFCQGKNRHGDEATFILSCGHVLRGSESYKTSASVIQASPSDGGSSRDAVAQFERGLSLDPVKPQFGDAAIAEVLPGIDHKNELLGIGKLNGTASPSLGMPVLKAGRTTGVTAGVVTCVALETWVPWTYQNARVQYRFTDLIRIESETPGQPFALPGDSGAIIATSTNTRAVALYFAGANDGVFGLGTPIQRIEERLSVRVSH